MFTFVYNIQQLATGTEYLASMKQQVDYRNENVPLFTKNHPQPFYLQNVIANKPRKYIQTVNKSPTAGHFDK